MVLEDENYEEDWPISTCNFSEEEEVLFVSCPFFKKEEEVVVVVGEKVNVKGTTSPRPRARYTSS